MTSRTRSPAFVARLVASATAAAWLMLGASIGEAQDTLVLEGEIPAGTPQYFELPFTVPAGIVEIEVRHDDLSDANILDWGLRDPTRFRGWGGGNTEPAVVGVGAASRSYLPGPIEAGEWAVLVGQARIDQPPGSYRIEIDLRTAPTLPSQPERAPYADVDALEDGMRWYAGDFHVHSEESGDATATLDEIAELAASRGLDFVALSEHNTVSALDYVLAAQARHLDVLFVPAIEVTTYEGHANAIGATEWVDFRIGDALSGQDVADAVGALGVPLSINHPRLDLGEQCIGCAWGLEVAPSSIASLELQNGAYSVTGLLFYRQTVSFWEQLLDQGAHVAPIGGSDDHRAGEDLGAFGSPIGSPTTMVYAHELSVDAIVEAVRAGRTVVKLEGPDDPMVVLRAGDAQIGDTVTERALTLEATVTGGAGTAVVFVRNGAAARSVDVDADDFTATHEVSAPPGDVDDRWRVELRDGSTPRVVTGHIWVAATGEPAIVDAGGEPVPPADGGCGCRVGGGGAGFGIAALGLALVAVVALRRRRR